MIKTISEAARQKAAQLLAGCDFTLTHPSFFIEWDKVAGQWKLSPDTKSPTRIRNAGHDGGLIKRGEG